MATTVELGRNYRLPQGLFVMRKLRRAEFPCGLTGEVRGCECDPLVAKLIRGARIVRAPLLAMSHITSATRGEDLLRYEHPQSMRLWLRWRPKY